MINPFLVFLSGIGSRSGRRFALTEELIAGCGDEKFRMLMGKSSISHGTFRHAAKAANSLLQAPSRA
jgi:hypothetical protein